MIRRLILLIGFMVLGLVPALASQRLALVVGNNEYPNLPAERQLQKAVNDARAIRDTLTSDLGFEVLYGENADWKTMNGLIKQLGEKVKSGDVIFVYYSGHGVSIGGENFLLPSDIPTPKEGEENRLIGNSFGAEELTRKLQQKGAQAVFAVLDACRDNPFVNEGGKSIGGRGGLTSIDSAKGVFTLFAAGLGQTALDRLDNADQNPNSVFTRNLIPLLKTPGLTQVELAKQVQEKVSALAASIGEHQEPAYYDQIKGYITLKDGPSKAEILDSLKIPDEPAPTAPNDWAQVQNSNSQPAIQAFLDKYQDDPIYRSLAEERLAMLLSPPKRPLDSNNVLPKIDDIPAGGCGTLLVSSGGADNCLKPGEAFTDCVGCPQIVIVPAGKFTMGSRADVEGRSKDEGPEHDVVIPHAIGVGKFEITYDEWQACADGGGCTGNASPDDGGFGRGKHPVINVSWDDAQEYATWLSSQSGKQYRLLTESEWEYAALGGDGSIFASLDIKTTDKYNFKSKSPVPVGSYEANLYGLYDMLGNVWEWTQDCYDVDYGNAPVDGSAHIIGDSCVRVQRGGGWSDKYTAIRIANRARSPADERLNKVGFRIARTLQ